MERYEGVVRVVQPFYDASEVSAELLHIQSLMHLQGHAKKKRCKHGR